MEPTRESSWLRSEKWLFPVSFWERRWSKKSPRQQALPLCLLDSHPPKMGACHLHLFSDSLLDQDKRTPTPLTAWWYDCSCGSGAGDSGKSWTHKNFCESQSPCWCVKATHKRINCRIRLRRIKCHYLGVWKLEMHCSYCFSLFHLRRNCPQKLEDASSSSGAPNLWLETAVRSTGPARSSQDVNPRSPMPPPETLLFRAHKRRI